MTVLWPAIVSGAAGTGAWTYATLAPNCPLFGPVVSRGARDAPRVYLTFDDGPNEDATPRVLDALGEAGVPAAFFLVGAHVRRFPSLARRASDEGHEIGNHTDAHVRLHLKGWRFVERSVGAAHAAIADATGCAPRSFRAPHGYHTPAVHRAARRFGYAVVGWTVGVWDTDRPGVETIRRRVRRALRPGAIVLLHDGDGYDPAGDRTQTAAAVPGIIRDARDAGFEFGSLRELLPMSDAT